jgi:hypothetical protein
MSWNIVVLPALDADMEDRTIPENIRDSARKAIHDIRESSDPLKEFARYKPSWDLALFIGKKDRKGYYIRADIDESTNTIELEKLVNFLC